MTDITKAIDAAREARKEVLFANNQPDREMWIIKLMRADERLGDLIAAIDAQQPVAWVQEYNDGSERDFTTVEPTDHQKKYWAEYEEPWQPLYAAPPAPAVPDREAVAIAICEAFTTPKGVLWWATTEQQREVFRGQADAAIAAMLAAAQKGE